MKFYKKKLKNGMTILFEKRDLPIISIALATRFGSGYEKEHEKGIAHFIEHMLFKGTQKRSSRQIIEEIDEKGGEYNAFTAKSVTSAWIRIPSKHLEFSIELLSDMFYNSQFNKEEMEKERGAIIEEINMYHDTPMRHVFEELNKLMFEKPFGLPALGSKESLNSFSREDLIKKYKENYFAENFVLVVVGKADFKEITALAEKYFSKSGKSKNNHLEIPKKKSGHFNEEREGLDQTHLAFGLHFPSLSDKERYSAKIFSTIFAEGSASKIYQEVREKRGLAYAVLGMLDQESNYGQELIYIGTLKDRLEEVKKIILEEVKKMKEIKDIEKTKQKLIDSKILEREDSRNVLQELLFEEISGNSEDYYNYEENLKKVKLVDVHKLANPENFSFVSLTSK
jgi:predicted Zn-dependent peptidase